MVMIDPVAVYVGRKATGVAPTPMDAGGKAVYAATWAAFCWTPAPAPPVIQGRRDGAGKTDMDAPFAATTDAQVPGTLRGDAGM